MVACNYVVICQRENVVGLCGNDFFNGMHSRGVTASYCPPESR